MIEVENSWDAVNSYLIHENRFTDMELIEMWNYAFPDQLILENTRETLMAMDKNQLVTMMKTGRYTNHKYLRFENNNVYSLSFAELYEYLSVPELATYAFEYPSQFDLRLV